MKHEIINHEVEEGLFSCHANNYIEGEFWFNSANTFNDKFRTTDGVGSFVNVGYYKSNPHITVKSSWANSIEEFKQWIANNNITLYYQKKNPEIIVINPLEFFVSQGTTININSNVSPDSTHTVILNRSGQIEQGIKLIANLRNKIDKLEREYDNNLLNTQLKINDLKLNLKLKGDN